jgi:hypothetical protein
MFTKLGTSLMACRIDCTMYCHRIIN